MWSCSRRHMRIPEHNWETGNVEEREYPDELFAPLIVWLLTTRAWMEDQSRVERRVLAVKREMATYRNPPTSHREAEAWGPAVREVMEAVAGAPKEALAQKRRE